MQKLLIFLVCGLFLSADLLWAQSGVKYEDRVMQNAATSAVNGNTVTVNRSNTIRLDVQITGTATVDFQISGSLAAAWYSKLCTASDSSTPVSGTSASGTFYCSVAGGQAFRTPISSYTSGTVTVLARATSAF